MNYFPLFVFSASPSVLALSLYTLTYHFFPLQQNKTILSIPPSITTYHLLSFHKPGFGSLVYLLLYPSLTVLGSIPMASLTGLPNDTACLNLFHLVEPYSWPLCSTWHCQLFFASWNLYIFLKFSFCRFFCLNLWQLLLRFPWGCFSFPTNLKCWCFVGLVLDKADIYWTQVCAECFASHGLAFWILLTTLWSRTLRFKGDKTFGPDHSWLHIGGSSLTPELALSTIMPHCGSNVCSKTFNYFTCKPSKPMEYPPTLTYEVCPEGVHHVTWKIETLALAGVAQRIEHWPVNQRVVCSIPSQGTCLGCRPGPQ